MAKWNLDPAHTSVQFAARHMMVTTVRGGFEKVSGTLEFDPQNPAATKVDVTIDAASINSGMTDRDNHLRSADFLDAAKYPTLTFKSTRVEVTGSDTAKLYGDLTIRGVTRPVALGVEYLGQVKSPFGDVRAGFNGSTKINREDWGLTWNVALEAGGVLVSKDLKIELSVEAVLVPESAPAAVAAV